MSEEEKICYKCIHFNSWEEDAWCKNEPSLSWNAASDCKDYEEKKK